MNKMNPQDIIEAIKTIIRLQTQNQASIALPFFKEKKDFVLNILKMMLPAVSDIDAIAINGYYDVAVREFLSVNPVDIDPSTSLTNKKLRVWLTDDRKSRLPKDYINRYLTHMRNEGRSAAVVSELSRSSEAILGKLGDPQSPFGFYAKGLVVGSVQSGKTGNFNAVINRAVDAGYNLVIILSGIMEDLRSQTQLRLELDVIGEGVDNLQTDHQGVKGVGKVTRFGVQGNSDIPQVFSITSHKSDFKKEVQDANFSLNHKNLLVCKKNTGVLKNLLIWLSDYLTENKDQHNIPLLIVDDEADNASLNNLGHKGREYASKINGHIRAILELFSRKTYLGYTATPFANVLQDRNEEAVGQWVINYKRNGEFLSKSFNQVSRIFPDDFIELLEPPSNYIGAKQIFETTTNPNAKKLPLTEEVTDRNESFPMKVIDEPSGKRAATLFEIENDVQGLRSPKGDDPFPLFLPQSLNEALECFILGIAIRLKRRPIMIGSKIYNPHNTMLIHVSRFTDWQNRTRSLVQTTINNLVDRIGNELPSSPISIYAELEKTWNKYYAAIVENIRTYLPDGYFDEFLDPVTFEQIKSLLPEAVKGLEVKAINSVTKEKLIYSTDASGNGKKFIAIGGNRLSRGFTLEGLTINYFIRDTNYADTLLQMGRWFGYRPGYIDCCKLFTTGDSIEKFDAATRTIEELELEFKKMHREGKSPDDFILRVRKHPGVLNITRPSILKNTEDVNWSYQDKLRQTARFKLDANDINNAWIDVKKLFHEFSWEYNKDTKFFILETDEQGLYRFLDCRNSFYEFSAEIQQIKAFVNLAVQNDKLKKWRIAINASGSGEFITQEETGLGHDFQLTKRSGPETSITQAPFRKKLIQSGIFTASSKSANLLSGGLDMAIWLTAEEIKKAEEDFVNDQIRDLITKGNSETEAIKIANGKTKPERIYRERMSDTSGLLVIFLMDLREVLPKKDDRLYGVRVERGIDVKIPLIGYALGFPPMSPTIGGTYVRGKYNIDEDEPEGEEPDEETLYGMEDAL